jgi:hypothetical protein
MLEIKDKNHSKLSILKHNKIDWRNSCLEKEKTNDEENW